MAMLVGYVVFVNASLRITRLLYPVHEKGYTLDEFISVSWRDLDKALSKAFLLSVFGYSAPRTDVEAMNMLSDGWGDPEQRNMEEIEIIDIADSDHIYSTWKKFIHTHHYDVHNSFFDSMIAKYPRRSCQAMYSMLIECRRCDPIEVPNFSTLQELHNWITPFIEAEGS